MKKEKKGNRWFNLGFDFDKVEEIMDKMMDSMLSDVDEERKARPVVMGFSLKVDSDGKPVIQEFGNLEKGDKGAEVSSFRKPLVDVINSGKELTITAELPGVEKKDIEVKKEKDRVSIKVNSKGRKFFKEIPLKQEIDPKSAKAKFNNGVLEITFKLLKPKRKAKGSISIE